ncbi:uncharacterized protein LOC143349652 [Colletes latitarsis]|uniref:uncharacterized protein LOC143349652 n=1 Tax=Colletes latitarsis TaxID=2605962 RepID=UPI004035C075
MCQPLPYANFQWANNKDIDVLAIALDSSTGYILEVDLEYPQHLHEAHTDLPFCPRRDKPPDKCQEKLLATLYNKKHYVIHYHNLRQYIRNGLRVTEVHHVLQFSQSPWLCDYIELNTKFRTLATNDFEKNLYKLMNNAVFGKTMENVRNYVDVKLVTKWEGRYGAEALIAKPNFHSRSVFSENLVAIKLRKLPVKFNKPIYVDNRYGISFANKKVSGSMKNENNGAIMTEFVGLRAKMYALQVDGKKDTKKVKSIKSNPHAAAKQRHIVHDISPHDDKRYIVPYSTETLPWGHYKIPL